MKTSFLLILTIILSLLIGCSEESEHEDLISNGNVESGAESPSYWFFNDRESIFSTSWSEAEFYSPSKSISISAENKVTDNFAYWGQSISNNIPTGETITLTAKIKGSLQGQGVSIVIRGDNSLKEEENKLIQIVSTQGDIPITGNFEWTEYSISLEDIDDTVDEILIYLALLPDTEGEVYFDDISLRVK